MKRFLILALTLILTIPVFSQEKKAEQNGKSKNEKIQSEKIAFFTFELDLTSEEAQVFWPVYNKYWKDVQTAHRETMKALHAMKGKKGETISAQEYEKRINAYLDALTKENKIIADYNPEFRKVLPVEKVAKLYVAEEVFRVRMIYSLRKEPANPPRNGAPNQNESPEAR